MAYALNDFSRIGRPKKMEEILELYGDPLDTNRPVVCFDETPYQLIAESRPSEARSIIKGCIYKFHLKGT